MNCSDSGEQCLDFSQFIQRRQFTSLGLLWCSSLQQTECYASACNFLSILYKKFIFFLWKKKNLINFGSWVNLNSPKEKFVDP